MDVDVNLNVNADGESVSSHEGGEEGEGEGEGEVGMRALSSTWRSQWMMAPGRGSVFAEREGKCVPTGEPGRQVER